MLRVVKTMLRVVKTMLDVVATTLWFVYASLFAEPFPYLFRYYFVFNHCL